MSIYDLKIYVKYPRNNNLSLIAWMSYATTLKEKIDVRNIVQTVFDDYDLDYKPTENFDVVVILKNKADCMRLNAGIQDLDAYDYATIYYAD